MYSRPPQSTTYSQIAPRRPLRVNTLLSSCPLTGSASSTPSTTSPATRGRRNHNSGNNRSECEVPLAPYQTGAGACQSNSIFSCIALQHSTSAASNLVRSPASGNLSRSWPDHTLLQCSALPAVWHERPKPLENSTSKHQDDTSLRRATTSASTQAPLKENPRGTSCPSLRLSEIKSEESYPRLTVSFAPTSPPDATRAPGPGEAVCRSPPRVATSSTPLTSNAPIPTRKADEQSPSADRLSGGAVTESPPLASPPVQVTPERRPNSNGCAAEGSTPTASGSRRAPPTVTSSPRLSLSRPYTSRDAKQPLSPPQTSPSTRAITSHGASNKDGRLTANCAAPVSQPCAPPPAAVRVPPSQRRPQPQLNTKSPSTAPSITAGLQPGVSAEQARLLKERRRRELYAWNEFLRKKMEDSVDAV